MLHLLSTRSRALPLFVLLAVASAAIWPTWAPLVGKWHDMADYSHGDITALVLAGWLLVRSGSLPPPSTRICALACGLLLVAIAGWLIAYQASSSIGQQLMLPVILWSAVWMGCGLPTALRVAAPVFCLYFTIPVWELLLPGLQRLTVLVSETTLGWFDIPVSIDGSVVSIPEGNFQIAEGCAGKRYFVVSLATAALFAGMSEMRPKRAAAFIAITVTLALLANWVRVVIVIYAGHVTNMTHYLVAREHVSFGWAVFAVLIAVVCLIGSGFATPGHEGNAARYAAPGSGTLSSALAGTAALAETKTAVPARHPVPQHAREAQGVSAEWQPRLAQVLTRPAMIATILVLCVPVVALMYARGNIASAPATPPLDLPQSAAGDWRGPLAPDSRWSPRYQGASSEQRVAYRGASGDVEVFVAQYGAGRPGAKLIDYRNTLLGDRWIPLNTGAMSRERLRALPSGARTIRAMSPTGERWVISYVYEVDSFVTASAPVAQLAYGALAWKGVAPSRVVAVAAQCRRPCEDTQKDLEGFWNAVGFRLLTGD